MTPTGSRVVRHRAAGRGLVVTLLTVATLAVSLAAAMTVRGDSAGGLRPPRFVVPWSAVPLSGADVEAPAFAERPPPDRIRIAAIGVDSPLERLDVDTAGTLQSPTDYGRAGWFAKGPAPGDLGPAVVAGHVDSRTGPAVFFRLPDLVAGDLIEVSRGGQWVAFRVVATEWHPKDRFPTGKVYGPTPVPELRLISCGGTFDRSRRSYRDNIVVYAIPAA